MTAATPTAPNKKLSSGVLRSTLILPGRLDVSAATGLYIFAGAVEEASIASSGFCLEALEKAERLSPAIFNPFIKY